MTDGERSSAELGRNQDALMTELRLIRDEMKEDRHELRNRMELIAGKAGQLEIRVAAAEEDIKTLYERAWWVATGAFAGGASLVSTVLGWARK